MSFLLRLLDGKAGLEIALTLPGVVILLAVECKQPLGVMLREAALHYYYYHRWVRR